MSSAITGSAKSHASQPQLPSHPRWQLWLQVQGVFAELLRKRFEVTCRRHGFGRARELQLDTSRFVPPCAPSPQGQLF